MAETQTTGTSCGKWGRPGCSWWRMGRAVGRITMGQITIWCVNFGDVPKNDVSWKIHDFPTCSHNGRGYQLVLTMDGPPQSLSKTALWIYRERLLCVKVSVWKSFCVKTSLCKNFCVWRLPCVKALSVKTSLCKSFCLLKFLKHYVLGVAENM